MIATKILRVMQIDTLNKYLNNILFIKYIIYYIFVFYFYDYNFLFF